MLNMLDAWQDGGLRCWTLDAHAFFPAAFRADVAATLLATLGSGDDGDDSAADDDAPAGGAAARQRLGDSPGLAASVLAPVAGARASPNPLRALQNEHVLDALFQALLTLHMGGPPSAPLVAE